MTNVKRLWVWLCFVITLVLLAGCATITDGPNQEVSLFSVPPGASVSIDGMPRGVTPTSVVLRKKQSHYVTFSKECYQPIEKDFVRNFRFGKWFFGNFFVWEIPGMIIDLASGSAYEIRPSNITAHLPLKEDDGGACRDYVANVEYGYINLIPTATLNELRVILQKMDHPEHGWSIKQLDIMANRVAIDSNSMDFEAEEAIAPLCRELGYSGHGRYKIFLYDIASSAVHPGLKKMAVEAAERLPDNSGNLPDYRYSSASEFQPSSQSVQAE